MCGKCKYYNIAFTSTILYCRKTISKDNPITRSKNFQNVWCIFPLNPRPGRFANHTWVKRSTQPGNRNRLGKTVWARSGLALRKNKQFGRRAATGEQNSFEPRRAAQGWAFGKNSFEPHGAAQVSGSKRKKKCFRGLWWSRRVREVFRVSLLLQTFYDRKNFRPTRTFS